MKMKTVCPSAVFFDMDGTLVDSYGFLMNAHNHVREAFGQPAFTQDEFLYNLSRTTRDVYRDLYGDQEAEAKKILYAYVESHRSERMTPMAGAGDLLRFLSAQGIALGVVSNMTPKLLRSQIADLGWAAYFGDAVVGAGDAAEPKPSAAPLLLAAERAGISFVPERVWMVGDTETDIACARAAGCVAVLLRSRRDAGTLSSVHAPDREISSLGELKGIFTTLVMSSKQADEILAPG